MHKMILAYDVGGTVTRIAGIWVTAASKEVTTRLIDATYQEFRTPASLEELRDLSEGAVTMLGGSTELHGVAMAISASVKDHAVVRESPNVPFLRGGKNVPLAANLRDLFGHSHAILANDMEAALAGEVLSGALRGARWAMMDTISTGWGGAMLYNGVEVTAEPGHIYVPRDVDRIQSDSLTCGCGRVDCAEARYSGGAIRRTIIAYCKEQGISIPDGMDACAFADVEYREGTVWARRLYDSAAMAIGDIWGSRLNLCPPIEKIVYMGTFAERFFALPATLERTRLQMLDRSLFRDDHAKIQIEPSTASHGALLGAARIFHRLMAV